MIEYRITEKENGRWFGLVYDTETNKRTVGKDGNDMDCYLYSPKDCLDCLVEQVKENRD